MNDTDKTHPRTMRDAFGPGDHEIEDSEEDNAFAFIQGLIVACGLTAAGVVIVAGLLAWRAA